MITLMTEREPIKVKVEAYYQPSINDIANIFIQATSEEQVKFFNIISEWFNQFNIDNPDYRKDAQFIDIWLDESLTDKSKEFFEKLDIFSNQRF